MYMMTGHCYMYSYEQDANQNGRDHIKSLAHEFHANVMLHVKLKYLWYSLEINSSYSY